MTAFDFIKYPYHLLMLLRLYVILLVVKHMPATRGLHQVCTISEFANAAKSVMGGWFRKNKWFIGITDNNIYVWEYIQFLYKYVSVYSHLSSQIQKFYCRELKKNRLSFILFKYFKLILCLSACAQNKLTLDEIEKKMYNWIIDN